jgi:hypothetical protein
MAFFRFSFRARFSNVQEERAFHSSIASATTTGRLALKYSCLYSRTDRPLRRSMGSKRCTYKCTLIGIRSASPSKCGHLLYMLGRTTAMALVRLASLKRANCGQLTSYPHAECLPVQVGSPRLRLRLLMRRVPRSTSNFRSSRTGSQRIPGAVRIDLMA